MALYDVTGIGNAIVDILSTATDDFIVDNNIQKGAMTLIDQNRAQTLLSKMPRFDVVSGGSAGNTMAGIGSFGGKGAYIGLVSNDDLGNDFARDMNSQNIAFKTLRHDGSEETARCYIFITPDGERSMNTFLGACTELSVKHIDPALIKNSAVTYMEGYLFDKGPAKEAFYMAADIAHKAGHEVALTLSDSFCVDRHRDDFMDLIKGNVNILFANENELKSLFQTDDFNAALEETSHLCSVVVATQSEKGATISNNGLMTKIQAEAVNKVIDVTGAGDQFAAGFLYGYTQNKTIEHCGKLGAKAAAEIISHVGPRPLRSYKDFL